MTLKKYNVVADSAYFSGYLFRETRLNIAAAAKIMLGQIAVDIE
jgi:hypothetical protein